MEIKIKANHKSMQTYHGLKILCLASYTNANVTIETLSSASPPYELTILNDNNDAVYKFPKHSSSIHTILNTIAIFSMKKSSLSLDEHAILDSWLQFMKHNIDIPYISYVQQQNQSIRKDIVTALTVLENELSCKPYMIGHEISLLDISIICFLETFWIDDNENMCNTFTNLKRLHDTIVHQSFYIQAKNLQNDLLSFDSM